MARVRSMREPSESDRGFTLVEVLVALVLVAIAAAGVAGLCAVAIGATRDARDETMATLMAGQKIEQLQSASWLSSDLVVSPPGTLDASVPGYAEFLDRHGRSIGGGASPPPGAAYVRRWSIEPAASGAPEVRIFRVLVSSTVRAGRISTAGSRARHAAEALVVAVRAER